MSTPVFAVYMLTNTVNGKRYIGVTRRPLSTRIKEHASNAKTGAKHNLAKAIRKYGVAAFENAVIYEAVDEREMKMVERGLIAQYGTTRKGGYNATSGGDGTPDHYWSPESRRRMGAKVSATLKANIAADPSRRLKLADAARCKKRLPEERAQIAESVRTHWATADNAQRRLNIATAQKKWREENPEAWAVRQRARSIAGAAARWGKKDIAA